MEGTVACLSMHIKSLGCVITHHVIQHDVSHDPQQGGLLDLPSVTLHHVISYLTDPHDLLNLGLTHP